MSQFVPPLGEKSPTNTRWGVQVDVSQTSTSAKPSTVTIPVTGLCVIEWQSEIPSDVGSDFISRVRIGWGVDQAIYSVAADGTRGRICIFSAGKLNFECFGEGNINGKTFKVNVSSQLVPNRVPWFARYTVFCQGIDPGGHTTIERVPAWSYGSVLKSSVPSNVSPRALVMRGYTNATDLRTDTLLDEGETDFDGESDRFFDVLNSGAVRVIPTVIFFLGENTF